MFGNLLACYQLPKLNIHVYNTSGVNVTPFPCEVHAEAEETVEHGAYYTTLDSALSVKQKLRLQKQLSIKHINAA
jgi:hypothetical protein